MSKILIIIPAYNEEKNIAGVINQLRDTLINSDILVVNDGSVDCTGDIARKEGVCVLDLPNNLGIGGALQTGYKFAKKYNYEIAVQIDGDGQHNAFDINALLKPIKDGQCDVVIGSRFINKDGFQSTFFRRLGIHYFSIMIKLFTGVMISDPTSGFRASNRSAIRYYASYYPTDYASVESITSSIKNGLRVSEVPVVMEERTKGVSSISMRKSIYYMIKVSLAVIFSVIKAPKKINREINEYEKNTNYISG